MAQWWSIALAAQRSWVQFPGNRHTDNKCIAWMYCKSLWIKASSKCINARYLKKLSSKVKWCWVWCNTGAKRPPSHSLHYLCHTHASAQILFNILSQSRLWQTMLLNTFPKEFNSLGYLSPPLRPLSPLSGSRWDFSTMVLPSAHSS